MKLNINKNSIYFFLALSVLLNLILVFNLDKSSYSLTLFDTYTFELSKESSEIGLKVVGSIFISITFFVLNFIIYLPFYLLFRKYENISRSNYFKISIFSLILFFIIFYILGNDITSISFGILYIFLIYLILYVLNFMVFSKKVENE